MWVDDVISFWFFSNMIRSETNVIRVYVTRVEFENMWSKNVSSPEGEIADLECNLFSTTLLMPRQNKQTHYILHFILRKVCVLLIRML